MPMQWTPEQVMDLAPDQASRNNARSLAGALNKWRSLQSAGQVIWGTCQGSGSDPYRCQVDLDGPAYKCSCPSRKIPCKHALALFILYITQPQKFETGEPPEWVTTWLARRATQNERRAAKNDGAGAAPVPDSTAQARRSAAREKKILAGITDLDLWLCDLLRQGLAAAQTQRPSFWENAAARLVDAQAPGLARMVRNMAWICLSGEGWQSRLLDQIGRLTLAMEGFRRLEQLPEDTQADLRSLAGISQKQEDILASGIPQNDLWLVLGRDLEEETGLKTQRTWLIGQNSRRAALVLSFAAPGSTLDTSLAPGMAIPADMVYYPGAYPLRAVLGAREPAQPLPPELPGSPNLLEGTAGFAAALAAYPWLERYPLALHNVTPCQEGDRWLLVDQDGRWIPLAKHFLHNWTLLAISGGAPVGVFGEWNGEHYLPLSAWADRQFYPFKPMLE